MFKNFKSEIKLFLIVVLIAVVISVAGILLLRYTQERNEFWDPHEPQIIEQQIQEQVTDFLKLNITSYVKAKPVLGASRFFVDDVEFHKDNKFIATFEDGHILGYMLGTYSTESGNIQIHYLAETFNEAREPSLEELKLQYGFINGTDTSNWQTYRNEEFGFEFRYPKDFFYTDPEVVSFDCAVPSFPAQCPNIDEGILKIQSEECMKIEESEGREFCLNAVRANFSHETYWKNAEGEKIAMNSVPYCLYEHGGAAAGSTYVNYYYVTLQDSACIVPHFVVRYTNCGVYGLPEEARYKQCEQENKTTKPQTLQKTLSTFRFTD